MYTLQPDPIVKIFDETRDSEDFEQSQLSKLERGIASLGDLCLANSEFHRAAYYFRILGSTLQKKAPNLARTCTEEVKSLASADPDNVSVSYHNIILLQKEGLETLFREHTLDFLNCVKKYDLHRLKYEPWLQEQLLSIAQPSSAVPSKQTSKDQARLFLQVLLTIASLQSPPEGLNELQKALVSFNAILKNLILIRLIDEDLLLDTCLKLNHELALRPTKETSTPADVHEVMRRSLRIVYQTVDAAARISAVLASNTTMDVASRAVLDFYFPHTRRQLTTAKQTTAEKKADLFDLLYYVDRDRGTIFRKEERRQLRKVTYNLLVITLAKSTPKSEEKEDKPKEGSLPIKPVLKKIVDKASAIEKSFGSGEFTDILEGLRNNLDQVIFEYQRFSDDFHFHLTELTKQTDLYREIYQQLNPSGFPVCDDPKTLVAQCAQDQDYRQYFMRDESGALPLHHAIRKGDVEGVKLLLQVAPYTQLQTKDKSGKLAKDYCPRGNTDMRQCLTEAANHADLFDYWFYQPRRKDDEWIDFYLITSYLNSAFRETQKSATSGSEQHLNRVRSQMEGAVKKTRTLWFLGTEQTPILKGILRTIEATHDNKLLLEQFKKIVSCYPYHFRDLLQAKELSNDEDEISAEGAKLIPKEDTAPRSIALADMCSSSVFFKPAKRYVGTQPLAPTVAKGASDSEQKHKEGNISLAPQESTHIPSLTLSREQDQ